jgi:hypothetical protein
MPSTQLTSQSRVFVCSFRTFQPNVSFLRINRPRSGRDIGFLQLIGAIREVYNLSYPLAITLSLVGILLCGRIRWSGLTLDLDALAAHNKIEHDASLAHRDGGSGEKKKAPIPVDRGLLSSFLAHATGTGGGGMTLDDFVRARCAREAELGRPLGKMHAEIGRGEVALAWLVMKDEGSGEVPVERLECWWGDERLPVGGDGGDGGWKRPGKAIGLAQARRKRYEVGEKMKAVKVLLKKETMHDA